MSLQLILIPLATVQLHLAPSAHLKPQPLPDACNELHFCPLHYADDYNQLLLSDSALIALT